MRKVLLLLLIVGVLLGGLEVRSRWRARAFDATCTYVTQCVEACRSTAAEVAMRKIRWVRDLPTALVLARQTGRLVFVLAADGDMCTGRL